MILIISSHDDGDALRVGRRLQACGHRVLFVDPADFPSRLSLQCGLAASRLDARLHGGGATFDLADVRVGWFRHPGQPVAPDSVRDAVTRQYIQDECKKFLDGLWATLDCQWIPGPRPTMLLAEHKLRQLAMAQALGFNVPETLLTNEPAAMLDFYRAHAGDIISKLPSSALGRQMPTLRRYTEPVRAADLLHHASVRLAPVLFQRNLSKRVEIRATVVGHQVFAAEIHSQLSSRTRQDWRRYNLDRTPHLPHALPEAESRRCVALTERLGLRYGAIDLVLTADGRYEFLEINPSGQWQWIEALTGLPIDAAMVDLLRSLDAPAPLPGPWVPAATQPPTFDLVTESC
jgi:hypothetical protein